MASLPALEPLPLWELLIQNLLILFIPFQMLLKCLSLLPGFRRISVKYCKEFEKYPLHGMFPSFRRWGLSSELRRSNEAQIWPGYRGARSSLWLEVHHLHLPIFGGTLQATKDLWEYSEGVPCYAFCISYFIFHTAEKKWRFELTDYMMDHVWSIWSIWTQIFQKYCWNIQFNWLINLQFWWEIVNFDPSNPCH